MTTKKIEIKPKIKPKKKKGKKPVAMAVENVYNSVLTGKYQASAERISTAQALMTLRSIELHKNEELETWLWAAYRDCREKMIKNLLTAALDHNLRLIDAQIILDLIRNEIALISAWEYEHLDEADEIIAPVSMNGDEKKPSKTLELFKALGTPNEDKDDDET
jgi:hypothetical protein